MTAKHDLDTLDRATLVAWRAWNTVKWSFAALAVAFAAAEAFGLVLSLFARFSIDESTRSGAALYALLIAVPTALSAIALGVIIGRHVQSNVVATASIVAFLHLAASFFIVVRGVHIAAPTGVYVALTPNHRNVSPILAMMILEIYIAVTMARRASAKRPRALRTGA